MMERTARACVAASSSVSSASPSTAFSMIRGRRHTNARRGVAAGSQSNARRRAQAGLYVDLAAEAEVEADAFQLDTDEYGNVTVRSSGSAGGRVHADPSGDDLLGVAPPTNGEVDGFDFEAEKTKLLEEREQLEKILAHIDAHEKQLKLMALAAGEDEDAADADTRTSQRVDNLGGLQAKVRVARTGGSAPSPSPAHLRRRRYRAKLRSNPNANAPGTTEVSASTQTARAAATDALDSGVASASSEADVGASSLAADLLQGIASPGGVGESERGYSGDAVTGMLNSQRGTSLLSREEEADYIRQAKFSFAVEDAVEDMYERNGTFPTYEDLAQVLYDKQQGSMTGANGKASQEAAASLGARARTLRARHLAAIKARRTMLDSNVRLVVYLAHGYKNHGLALSDLVQEGMQGLMTAMRKFDLRRKVKFSTYATWWVKQALLRGICNYSRDVRLPVHVTDTFQAMSKIQRGPGPEGTAAHQGNSAGASDASGNAAAWSTGGKDPRTVAFGNAAGNAGTSAWGSGGMGAWGGAGMADVDGVVDAAGTDEGMGRGGSKAGGLEERLKYSPEELASIMGVKVDKLYNVLEATKTAISMEQLTERFNENSEDMGSAADSEAFDANELGMESEEASMTLDALLTEHMDHIERDLDAELYERVLQEDVDATLRMLPPRERNIIRMRFGLTPIDDMCLSLVDIGAAYGLNRERVRQMEARALNKLRQPRLSSNLKKYTDSEPFLYMRDGAQEEG